MARLTTPGKVDTADGIIPYLPHPKGAIWMPVMVQTRQDERGFIVARTVDGRPVPVRDRTGRLVYALPGGGRFVGEKQWR